MLITSHSTSEHEFRFTLDMDDGAADVAALSGPWQLEVVDARDIKLTDCVYQRGPATVALADILHTVAGSDTVYLGIRIDLDSGAVTVIEGAAKASVTDSDVPSDPQYFKKLLYALLVEDDMVSVIRDYRLIPEVVSRV